MGPALLLHPALWEFLAALNIPIVLSNIKRTSIFSSTQYGAGNVENIHSFRCAVEGDKKSPRPDAGFLPAVPANGLRVRQIGKLTLK